MKIDESGIYVNEINPTVNMIVIVGLIVGIISGILVMCDNYSAFS